VTHVSTQRHIPKVPVDEERLVERIITLASQYGRYGYRRITALLQNEGWKVNHKRVERIWRQDVLDQLFDLFIIGVTTLFIEPGSPWENGYVESFNGKLRDELLNGEIFDTLLEARVLLESWRREYNCYRPHSSLQYRPPAPEAFRPNILSLKVLH